MLFVISITSFHQLRNINGRLLMELPDSFARPFQTFAVLRALEKQTFVD